MILYVKRQCCRGCLHLSDSLRYFLLGRLALLHEIAAVMRPVGRDKLKNASILRKYGSICMGEKPRLFYNITEDVKARKANAFENFPAFDLIAFIVVVFYERNSDNGLICIPIVYKPFEIG